MKRLLLSLLLASFSLLLFAANVELQDAKILAKNAYYQKLNTYVGQINYDALEIDDYYIINRNGESVMYAFNFTNYGFILIAAEDAIEPVLGYTFDNHYSTGYQPEGFKGLLWEYGTHIMYLRENKIAATPNINQQWADLTNFKPMGFIPKDSKMDIEPLLTSTWNQDWPYNYYCPLRTTQPNSNGHALVGCVATAMSQIMLYWRYPLQGSGSHSYFCYPFGTLSANFGETTYDWNAMQDNVNQINLAVALIGYHAGVAVEMDYNHEGGSGAFSTDVPYALKTYFNYSINVAYKSRANYSLTDWENMAQEELEENCPVYYSGQSPEGGHAFVLDGYHELDGMYHFNFGWSGSGNGWYLISDAGGFNSSQGMIINIVPYDQDYPYGCNPDFELSNLLGSFEDGSGPQQAYEEGVNCSWLLNPQTEEDSVRKIKLNFVMLDTEEEDIITIYDGASTSDPVLGTYSGSEVPSGNINSTGNQMLIVLEGDGDGNTGQGFKVEYVSILPDYCENDVHTEPIGLVSDGSGTFFYTGNTSCNWQIKPDWASDVTLTFTEFHTEEDVDIVKVYDIGVSPPLLLAELSGEYTVENLPEPIFCESGKMGIIFQSDEINNAPGWNAEWQVGNVGIDTENIDFNKLLVYPNPAENLLNVSFELKDTRNFQIKLISVTGNIIYQENHENFSGHYTNTIDISKMARGVYFLNLSNDLGTINKKVIVK